MGAVCSLQLVSGKAEAPAHELASAPEITIVPYVTNIFVYLAADPEAFAGRFISSKRGVMSLLCKQRMSADSLRFRDSSSRLPTEVDSTIVCIIGKAGFN